MNGYRIVPFTLVVASMLACFGGGEVDMSPAESELKKGDLAAASTAYATLAKDNPESAEAAIGAAYMDMLAGNYDAADKTLLAAEAVAGEKVGEIKLRRAIVALRAGNLDDVKKHGKDSGLAAGQLLAAEVHIVDGELDDALSLLREARSGESAIGDAASTYLRMLEGTKEQAGFAEATALWAVGQRDVACDVAGEIVPALSEEDDKANQLLLWAGRAATSQRPGVATTLLDELEQVGAPNGQEWRVQATRAMVEIVEGESDSALARFTALEAAIAEGFAPYEGVADARATAAALTTDRAVAKKLTDGLEGAAVARGLQQAGAGKVAKDSAEADSPLARYLESK